MSNLLRKENSPPVHLQSAPMMLPPLSYLPAVNASLNAACTVFLLCGYSFIRRRKILPHKICMLSAFGCSMAFLVCYVYFHVHAGIIRFGGQGVIRPIYFTILISHMILAVVILPLVIITLTFALRGEFSRHRRIARWTFPIWLYVSITGVIVYWLLYILYTPLEAALARDFLPVLLHRLV
jgi:putative membrane protein